MLHLMASAAIGTPGPRLYIKVKRTPNVLEEVQLSIVHEGRWTVFRVVIQNRQI